MQEKEQNNSGANKVFKVFKESVGGAAKEVVGSKMCGRGKEGSA